MKQLNQFILEKLKLDKNVKGNQYEYFPNNSQELSKIIDHLIKERGNEADLNDIDTSNIDDMWCLFRNSEFNGDISEWDVSNVKEIQGIFEDSQFNQDISKWNINIKDSFKMFQAFKNCPLEKNPPKWYDEWEK